ncbi:Uncharacterised protein [Mycobacteroides abscessus subsp. abscessus]|nr:Uncharacterised protein [Mycobacteroides abscessus subsp. abscessus]
MSALAFSEVTRQRPSSRTTATPKPSRLSALGPAAFARCASMGNTVMPHPVL